MAGRAFDLLMFCVLVAPMRHAHRGALAVGAACSGIAFVVLAILAHRIPYFSIDLVIARHVQAIQASWFDGLLLPLNVIGFPPLVAILYGAIILVIFAAGARWEAMACCFATLGSAALNFIVKELVERPRPSTDLVHVAHQLPGSAFPAGHVLNITVFAGFLCYLTIVRLTPSWPRTALSVLLVGMILIMGIARIDAGEHWASDVLGGYLLGMTWLAATIEFYQWGRRRKLGAGSRDTGGPRAGQASRG